MTERRLDTYAELRLAEGKLLGWDVRTTTVRCALQPRDVEILTALARYRFLTTAQIAELWWEGKGLRAVRRRLTRLFDAGLVERFRPQTLRGAFQWTYCLTRDGFRAVNQSGGLPPELKFTPRRDQIFDYRYVIHDLRVNEWIIRFRRLASERVLDWAGPDESRIEPTSKLSPGQLTQDGSWGIWDLDWAAIRPIQPDARLEVGARSGDVMLFVEYDRTRRVDKNYDKFRRYEAFIVCWWRFSAVREWGRPFVVFICQNEEHRSRFLTAADSQLTAHRSRWTESGREEGYPARDRILFAIEKEIHDGNSTALRLPQRPPGHPERSGPPTPVREVRLPGAKPSQ